jgi:hypothetical protein
MSNEKVEVVLMALDEAVRMLEEGAGWEHQRPPPQPVAGIQDHAECSCEGWSGGASWGWCVVGLRPASSSSLHEMQTGTLLTYKQVSAPQYAHRAVVIDGSLETADYHASPSGWN